MSEENITKPNHRIINFYSEFNQKSTHNLITQLINLETQAPAKDIIIYIYSYGGEVNSYLALHDYIKNICRSDIVTVGIGAQMSCGQMLLMTGTKNKRFATQNSRILMHELSSHIYGKLSEMDVDINESKELMKIMKNLIIKYTKINKKDLTEMLKSDYYMSAQEALKYGIIDHIIKEPSDLYKKVNI